MSTEHPGHPYYGVYQFDDNNCSSLCCMWFSNRVQNPLNRFVSDYAKSIVAEADSEALMGDSFVLSRTSCNILCFLRTIIWLCNLTHTWADTMSAQKSIQWYFNYYTHSHTHTLSLTQTDMVDGLKDAVHLVVITNSNYTKLRKGKVGNFNYFCDTDGHISTNGHYLICWKDCNKTRSWHVADETPEISFSESYL